MEKPREFNNVSVLYNGVDSSNDNYNRYTFKPKLYLIEISAFNSLKTEAVKLRDVVADTLSQVDNYKHSGRRIQLGKAVTNFDKYLKETE